MKPDVRRGNAVLVTVLALLIALPGAAAGGGPRAGTRIEHAAGPVVVDKRPLHRSPFHTGAPVPFLFPPVVVGGTVPVAVPVPFAVPVPVVVAPPPVVETAPPPPPAPTYETPSRPTVANPGPKIIEISPPARGAKTVTITVHRGSSTVVETVPVQ